MYVFSDIENWEQAQLVNEIIRLITSLITLKVENISRSQWDFILISFSAWSSNMSEMKSLDSNLQVIYYKY